MNKKQKIILFSAVGILVVALVAAGVWTFTRRPAATSSSPSVQQKVSSGQKDTVLPTVQLVVTAASLEAVKTKKALEVSATAKDNTKVTKVEYELDGKVVATSAAPPFTVAIDTSKLAVGEHTIVAFAYDATGNKGKSEAFVFKLDADQKATPATEKSKALVQQSSSNPPPSGGTTPPPSGGGGTNPPSGGGGSSCALPAYPTAACTGVPTGTTLTLFIGDMNITTAGTVINGLDIQGCIEVHAPGIIIRNTKITCTGNGIFNYSTNLLIEDTDISCNDTLGGTGITPQDYTARRVNVHDCDNVTWAQANVLIEDSYIHDPITYDPITDPHTDGVQVPAGGSDITLRHNTIYGNYESSSSFGNSAITSGGDNVSNMLIVDNLLAGGGYTLYCPLNGSGNNFRVLNNHFSTIFVQTVGGYGPWIYCQDETQVTGNVYHETGLPVPF